MDQGVTATNLASALPQEDQQSSESFIHPSAVIDSTVLLGRNVTIHANVVIDRNVRIGDHTEIQPGCFIAEDCVIEDSALLCTMVTLREKTRIGSRTVIEPGVVIGSDGFGYAKEQNGINCKVPQVGYVVIEDDVHIGANTTIDRATLGETRIAKGSKIGSLVQIGHNVTIGDESVVGNSTGVCGSCRIGAHATIGQGVGMVGHIRIGNHAVVNDGAGVSKDIHDGDHIIGVPGLPEEAYNVYQETLMMLPQMTQRLQDIEEQLKNR
jgi:UDP-3-O-[3-hydroxymyristoyl] glucosamine N-acyltransferase